MEADELYTVKNNVWLGNFQDAIAEAKGLRLKSDALKVERDVLIFRSLIGLRNFKAVLDDVREETAPIPLQATRLLALYHSGSASARERGIAGIEALAGDAHASSDATVQLIAAYIYINEGNTTSALKALRNSSGLEHHALLAQLYLRIDRPDLAERTVKAMQGLDDESALTVLSNAQLNLTLGGDRTKEAGLLFRELNDRFGSSVAGVNGLAAVYIAQHKPEDAERLLAELLESHPGQPDALLNLVAIAAQTGRGGPDGLAKATAALKAAAPSHPYLQQAALLEGTFDRVAASFAV